MAHVRQSRVDRRDFLKIMSVAAGSFPLIGSWSNVSAGSPGKGKVARIAFAHAPGGPSDKAAHEFAKWMLEKTGGELTVQVFAGGQLGGEKDMAEALQMGSVEITPFGSYAVTAITPEWGLVLDTPYVMRNNDHFRKVVDGPLCKPMYEAMLKRKGIRHICWSNRGPRYLTTNKPVKEPADLKGIKIRVPEYESYVAAWKMLGATVTPMAFPEVFLALKQGTIDAMEAPLEILYTSSFFEVQKYLNLTSHIVTGYQVAVSEKWYQSLSPALRKTVSEGLVEMGKLQDKLQAQAEAEFERKLKEKGMIFNPVDIAKFQTALRELPRNSPKWKPGFYEEIQKVK